MKKNTTIVILLLVVAILIGVTVYQSDRLNCAEEYINALENDYPDFIDTTSGTDAYSNWYN